MKELFEKLLSRLEAGQSAVLVRVVASSGSAPRGTGASMLADAGGYVCGTVGGGTVEHRALAQAAEVLAQGGHRVRDYALRNREAADLGMVCGGDMRLLFQRLGVAQAALCREALEKIADDEAAYLLTDLASGRMWLAAGQPEGTDCFAQRLTEAGRTYIFGAGHVALALVPVLARLGFRAVVLDDRPDFADPARFPEAFAVRVADFARLNDLPIGARDDVVIMTRGHQHDQEVLSQMLRTPARYIGMMGSKAKRAFVYASLREQGFSEADIARVHSPVGLPIGAQTPEEIAVSIAAELIQVRAGRSDRA